MTRPFTLANDDLIFAVSGTAPPADYVVPVDHWANTPSHSVWSIYRKSLYRAICDGSLAAMFVAGWLCGLLTVAVML